MSDSLWFCDARPPHHMRYPVTDVFRRAVWARGGKQESIVARGPAGTSAEELDAILTTKCREMGVI